MHLATDPDFAAEPLDTRVYGPGASTLQSPEDVFEPQHTMNTRI
jgi:hypothetical protein